jgi:Icc-related predicted phosphoesterase
MLKITALSDSHGLHDSVVVPKSDLLVHTGDFCNQGTLQDVIAFAKWFSKQEADCKVCVAGNHDLYCEQSYSTVERIFAEFGINYLENSSIEYKGFNIYGTPYTPVFFDWAYMFPREEMYDKVWSKVPDNTNILLTHGPMKGCLDKVLKKYANEDDDFHVGCTGMLQRVKELKELELIVCGHIHSGYGVQMLSNLYHDRELLTVINASICNEKYRPLNKPIEVEL